MQAAGRHGDSPTLGGHHGSALAAHSQIMWVWPPTFAIHRYESFRNPEPPEPLLLNSFFLTDLATAADHFRQDVATANLRRYLGVTRPETRRDLLHDKGALVSAIRPILLSPASASRSTAACACGGFWTGAAACGRVEPLGCPGGTAAGQATWQGWRGESVMLAPKSEVSLFPWEDSKDKIPVAVRQVRSFLRAHRPAMA